MTELIEKLSFTQLSELMREHGYVLNFHPRDKDNQRYFLIEFTAHDAQCFVYYSDAAKDSHSEEIVGFILDAILGPLKDMNAEDINALNSHNIRGYFYITEIDAISYRQYISLHGGVTKAHILNQIEHWAHTVQCGMDHLELVAKGVGEVNTFFDEIKRRNK